MHTASCRQLSLLLLLLLFGAARAVVEGAPIRPHAEAEVALGIIFGVAPCPLGARPALALALAAADAEIDAAVEAEPHGLTAKAGRMIARAAVAAVAAAGLLLVPESAAAVLLKVFVVLVLILAPRVDCDCGRDCCCCGGGGGGGGRAWPLL